MSDAGEQDDGAAGIPEPLVRDLRTLARVPRLLIALDFDGTLSPVVDRPEAARALPEAVRALDRLRALPDTFVAYVSGRALDSLSEVTSPTDDILLAGSHGAEFRMPGGEPEVAVTAEERERLARLNELLTAVADGFAEVWIEAKPAGFALHTRRATPEDAARAQAEARERALAADGGLTAREGKDVLEFSVRTATKGDAIDTLRKHVEADAVLYAGDDVTDEDGFAALGDGDLGLKVGPGATAAGHRVDDPAMMARVLGLLADHRASGSPE